MCGPAARAVRGSHPTPGARGARRCEVERDTTPDMHMVAARSTLARARSLYLASIVYTL